MKRRYAGLAIALGLYGGERTLAQPRGPARIGWLSYTRADSPLRVFDALRLGLRDLGYVEGYNIVVEARWGDDSRERLDLQAAELLRWQPDVIVAQGPAVFALQRSATKLPVVFVFSGDPIEAGLADSLARPGRNMTGVSQLSLELVGKRMEILKSAMPQLKRMAVVANTAHAGEQTELRTSQAAASALGLTLDYVPLRAVAEIETALATVLRSRSEAISVFPDVGMMRLAERFAAFATDHRVPSISGWAEFAKRGNLLSYGPQQGAAVGRLAYFVDRILKGAKPADLPIELPTVLDLTINLKAAKALGITIPKTLLLRADEVIE